MCYLIAKEFDKQGCIAVKISQYPTPHPKPHRQLSITGRALSYW